MHFQGWHLRHIHVPRSSHAHRCARNTVVLDCLHRFSILPCAIRASSYPFNGELVCINCPTNLRVWLRWASKKSMHEVEGATTEEWAASSATEQKLYLKHDTSLRCHQPFDLLWHIGLKMLVSERRGRHRTSAAATSCHTSSWPGSGRKLITPKQGNWRPGWSQIRFVSAHYWFCRYIVMHFDVCEMIFFCGDIQAWLDNCIFLSLFTWFITGAFSSFCSIHLLTIPDLTIPFTLNGCSSWICSHYCSVITNFYAIVIRYSNNTVSGDALKRWLGNEGMKDFPFSRRISLSLLPSERFQVIFYSKKKPAAQG